MINYLSINNTAATKFLSKEKSFFGIKSLILCCLMLIINSSVYAGFDPNSFSYKKSAPLVGTWAGKLFDKPFEISIWPSPEFQRLTGAMIWGSCKTAINIEYIFPSLFSRHKLSLPNQGIYKRLFSFGTLSEGFISDREEIIFKFNDNKCPKESYPGYSRKYPLYFISDPSYSTLTAYIQKKNHTTLEKQTGTLSRVKPTVPMNEAIQKLSIIKIFKLDRNSKIAIDDPDKNYLDVVESNKFNPNLVYKTKDYWQSKLGKMDRYGSKREVQQDIINSVKNTFDGVFDAKEPNIYNYRLIYRAYVEAYGGYCRDYLDEPLQITESLNEIDENGVVTRDRKPVTFFVENRFYDKYDAYRPVLTDYVRKVGMGIALSGGSIGGIMTAMTVHKETVDKIISNISCDSATMRQLNENMWRSAHGQPSLQASGGAIKGAEKETEAALLKD